MGDASSQSKFVPAIAPDPLARGKQVLDAWEKQPVIDPKGFVGEWEKLFGWKFGPSELLIGSKLDRMINTFQHVYMDSPWLAVAL